MTYFLAGLIIVLLVLLVAQYRANVSRETELLNRIQAPQTTVSQSLTEKAGPQQPAYIPPFDDEATAEYESERDKLIQSTRELITANTGASE